jgi:hypothetical protein
MPRVFKPEKRNYKDKKKKIPENYYNYWNSEMYATNAEASSQTSVKMSTLFFIMPLIHIYEL